MTLEQSQATESQVRYSPEEAHEILRLAAEMQESALSVEQLRRIAQEAGIADEYLERAIQHYEQRRRRRFRKRLHATPRERRFKRAVWTLVASGVVVALSLLWNIIEDSRAFANGTRPYPLDSLVDPLRSEVFSPYRAPQFAPMTPLASSPTLEVYKVRWSSGNGARACSSESLRRGFSFGAVGCHSLSQSIIGSVMSWRLRFLRRASMSRSTMQAQARSGWSTRRAKFNWVVASRWGRLLAANPAEEKAPRSSGSRAGITRFCASALPTGGQ
jgi:hypothetical protein